MADLNATFEAAVANSKNLSERPDNVTLLHEMQRRDAKKGLAALCIGGGMGVSLAVER